MLIMARILIIDDDAHTCQMVGEFLRRQGNEVTSANDGGTGLAMAAAEVPNLILCDLDMPGMDGQGVVTALRQNEKLGEIPIIFLSGCTDREQIRRTMNLGADDFLGKPARLTEILEAVNARLTLHHKKKERETTRIESAVSYFSGIIHDLQNPSARNPAARLPGTETTARAGQILEQVRQRLYPAKGATPLPAATAFLAKDADRQQLVKLSEVRMFLAYGEYSKAFWGRDQHMLIRKSLVSWQRELPEHQFVRVHRQAVVNLAFLEQVEKGEGKVWLRLKDLPEPVPVSQRCAPVFNRRLKQYRQIL